MENQTDISRNPDSFMQIGDLVSTSFLLAAFSLLAISIFILVQMRSIPGHWKLPIVLSTVIALISAITTLFRWNYWVVTETNPVEFRFVDWFITVPLAAMTFYYVLKPLGARRWMPVRLFIAGLWMIFWGYIGEALYPENSQTWGFVGSLGFAALIGMIMGEGYTLIGKPGVNPIMRKGYLGLTLLLAGSWSIYPLGYMTVPGNVLEGTLEFSTVAILYNLADILSKGGIAIGTVYIASKTGEDVFVETETALTTT